MAAPQPAWRSVEAASRSMTQGEWYIVSSRCGNELPCVDVRFDEPRLAKDKVASFWLSLLYITPLLSSLSLLSPSVLSLVYSWHSFSLLTSSPSWALTFTRLTRLPLLVAHFGDSRIRYPYTCVPLLALLSPVLCFTLSLGGSADLLC